MLVKRLVQRKRNERDDDAVSETQDGKAESGSPEEVSPLNSKDDD